MFTQAKLVQLAIFDVDGVLSDGGLHYAETGDAMKTFDVRDGMGMKLLQDAGVSLAIITSRSAGSVMQRAADLGIRHVQQGVADKLSAFETLLAELAVRPEHCAFLGDDLVDLPVLQRAGFALPVADSFTKTVLYRDAFHLMADLRAMGEGNALAARLKYPTRRAVLARAAQIYAETFATPEGLIPATFEVICLTGWAPHEGQQKPLRPGSATARLEDALKAAVKNG